MKGQKTKSKRILGLNTNKVVTKYLYLLNYGAFTHMVYPVKEIKQNNFYTDAYYN